MTEDLSGAIPILFSLAQPDIAMKESDNICEIVDASGEMSG